MPASAPARQSGFPAGMHPASAAMSVVPEVAWYAAINQVSVGPMRLDEFERKVAAGAIRNDTLVWREGFAEWIPYAQVTELHRPSSPPLRHSSKPPSSVREIGARPSAFSVAPSEPIASPKPGLKGPAIGSGPLSAARSPLSSTPAFAPIGAGGKPGGALKPMVPPTAPSLRKSVVPLSPPGRAQDSARPSLANAFSDAEVALSLEALTPALEPPVVKPPVGLDTIEEYDSPLLSSEPKPIVSPLGLSEAPQPADPVRFSVAPAAPEATRFSVVPAAEPLPQILPTSAPAGPVAPLYVSEVPAPPKKGFPLWAWIAIAAAGGFGVTLAILVAPHLIGERQVAAPPAATAPKPVEEKRVARGTANTVQMPTEEEVAPVEESVTQTGKGGSGKTLKTAVSSTKSQSSDGMTDKERAMLERMGGQGVGINVKNRNAAQAEEEGEGLNENQLAAVVKKNRPALQRCYEVAMRGQGEASTAKVNVHISVGASGIVTKVSTAGKNIESMSSCIESAVKRWRFPQAAGSTETQFPVVFQPGA